MLNNGSVSAPRDFGLGSGVPWMSIALETASPPRLSRPGLFIAWLVLGTALSAATVFLGVLNHDVAWYLLVARRVSAGERLYIEVFDTNPPLIIWLNLPAVLLAKALGISEIVGLRVLVLALIGVSLGLTDWALGRAMPDRVNARRVLLLLSLFVLLPAVGYDFAQREHLMMILALPYVMLASARATVRGIGGILPWVVGILAGVGLSIKPHFLLLWLAVEATLILRRGWRIAFRPEGLMIVAIGLSYAVSILTVTPSYLPWINRITSVYYRAGGATVATLATERGTIVTILGVIAFLVLRPSGGVRRRIEVILAANLALLTIALLQLKGFPYQFYPPMALGILLMGWVVVEPRGEPGWKSLSVRVVRVTLAILLVVVSVQRCVESVGWRGHPGNTNTFFGRMIRATKEHAGGGSIFMFSTAVAAGFPMVNYTGVEWASRHPALLFLPGCYSGESRPGAAITFHPPDRMGAGERFLFDNVIERLLKDQPGLIFVDDTTTNLAFDGRTFDYLGYYSQDPRFAKFLRDYVPLNRVDQFRLYRRRPRSSKKPKGRGDHGGCRPRAHTESE